jgi:hypothetical protein
VLAVAQLGGADSESSLLSTPPFTVTASQAVLCLMLPYRRRRLSRSLPLAAEATPKSVLRAMAVPGLTLYHLKRHLQVRPATAELFLSWLVDDDRALNSALPPPS